MEITMNDKPKTKKKVNPVIIILAVLVIIMGGYLLFNSGIIGGNSCEALLKKYNAAAAVEDYKTVNETFPKLMEKGCEF